VPPPAEHGCGIVFELTLGTSGNWTEKVLHNFGGNEVYPVGGVILVTAGNLYGNFVEGGVDGWGGVFELTLSNGKWTQKLLQLRRRPRGWILSELRTDFRRGQEPVWRNC
jgi:hypothetical protein